MSDPPSYGVQHASYLVFDSLPQLLIPSRAHPMIPILTRTCSVCVPSKSHHFQGRYAIPELTGFLVCGVMPPRGRQVCKFCLAIVTNMSARAPSRSREWMQAHRLHSVHDSGLCGARPRKPVTRAAAKRTFPVSSAYRFVDFTGR